MVLITDIEKLVERIKQEIRDFCDIAVIGMSGGADSTLVATLCMQALGPENVHSLHMPYNQFDSDTFNTRSMKAAQWLGIQARSVPIAEIADGISNAVWKATNNGPYDISTIEKVNDGNARSRARMTVLYGTSWSLGMQTGKRARVMGTGNLSEDFIGYDTKGGDALADIFPIGELLKSEVYQLLEYFRDKGIIDEEHIDRVPSAGLWDGQTDEEELGHSYASMEPIIKAALKNGYGYDDADGFYGQYTITGENGIHDVQANAPEGCTSELVDFTLGMREANKHKHEAPPSISLREFCQ